MEHRQDIEGLRAVAVIAVIAYHAGVPLTGGGFVGVDVFLVISGFLITSLLLNEWDGSGRISLTRFYARRARRLLPISAVVLTTTGLASVIWLEPTKLDQLGVDILAASGFALNLVLAGRGTDYLGAELAPSAIQHYWSLAVEEQFYVVWPALILVALRIGRRAAIGTVVAITAASALASALLTGPHPTWSYLGLHTRAWELGLGALLALTLATTRRAPASLRAGLGWIGLVSIAVAVATFDRVEHFPGTWAALPVIGAAFVLISGDDNPLGVARLLRFGPFQWAGSRSYSLYLWHWPARVIGTAAIGREPGLLVTVALVASSVALAEIGFRLIENPIRRSPRLARRSGLSLTVGAGLLAIGSFVGLAVSNVDTTTRTGVIATTPEPIGNPSAVTEAGVDPTPDSEAEPDPVALDAIGDALEIRVVPDNLRPSLLDAEKDIHALAGMGCHQYLEEQAAEGCVFGDPDGDLTVALWGDSHAAQWFPAIDMIAQQRGWRLVAITQGGCPVIDVLTWSGSDVRDHCAAWRESALDRFAAEGVDAILLGQYYGLLDAGSRAAVSATVWAEQLPRLLDRLSENMTPIVLIDTPDLPVDVPTCLSEHPEEIDICEPGAPSDSDAAVAATVREITAERGIVTFDPRPLLCVDDRCPVVVGDILVYRDSNHLSDTFARWFTPVLDRALGPYIDSLR